MRPRCAAAALALALGATAALAPAHAEEQRFVVDPERSTIAFTLAATAHTVHGSLPVASGEILLDDASGAASGEVVADATRATTGNERRDRKMHRDVLLSASHPRIVFAVHRVLGSVPDPGGTAKVTVHGAIAIAGETHPVTVTGELTRKDGVLRASATLQVPYVAWGLRDPSVFVLRVAKEVDVSIDLVGTLDDAGLAVAPPRESEREAPGGVGLPAQEREPGARQ